MATKEPDTASPQHGAQHAGDSAAAETGRASLESRFFGAPLTDHDDIFGEAGFGMEAGLPPTHMRELLARSSLGRVSEDAIAKAAAQDAPANDSPQARGGFEYGWCYTDHKTGKEIRKDFRSSDYLNDEPYATRVHAMLEQLGLPAPKEGEVFRGTHHDLLFLNSHGVVVRIGPQDVEDLLNPGILQPLGWLEDRDTGAALGKRTLPLTVAVYPGVELYEQHEMSRKKPVIVGDLYELMTATKQGTGDVLGQGNTGLIRVLDDDGHEVAVRVLIDPDNDYNGASSGMRKKRISHMQAQTGTAVDAAPAVRKGDILFNTLREVFNAARNVHYWEKAHEVHQPLRNMFWDAFQGVEAVGGVPDIAKRDAFWQTCAAVTNKPMQVTLPVWRTSKDAHGKMNFERSELHVPHVVLYRPWTGQKADLAVQPITSTQAVRAAVGQAHAKMKRGLGGRIVALGQKIWHDIRHF